jgi:aspartate/methionine/tyrosine aminotransferase
MAEFESRYRNSSNSRSNTSHFATIQALVDTDDEVIILDPSYDCYEAPVLLCKAKPVRIALMMTIPQLARIEKACSSRNQDDYHQQST